MEKVGRTQTPLRKCTDFCHLVKSRWEKKTFVSQLDKPQNFITLGFRFYLILSQVV